MKLLHLSCLIKATHAYDVLATLDGISYDLVLRPVTKSGSDDEARQAKPRKKKGPMGMYKRVAEILPEGKTFGRVDIKEAIVKAGGKATSVGSCTGSMLSNKLVRKKGRDVYERIHA